jgi:hypothetical protein
LLLPFLQLNCRQLKDMLSGHAECMVKNHKALAYGARRTRAASGDVPFVTTGAPFKAFNVHCLEAE